MSNNRKHSFYGRALLMVLLGVLLLGASLTVGRISARPEKVAARIAGHIDKRVKILDGFMEQMASSIQEWTHLEKFPDDMVVYRYVCDTLQCWNNRFPIINDDIRARMRVQRIIRPEFEITSPLNGVGEQLRFLNLGSKWYLIKWSGRDNLVETIGAVEVCSSPSEGVCENMNRKLGLKDNYEIFPIGLDSGETVFHDGIPLFCIRTNASELLNSFMEALLRWLALLLFVTAAIYLLACTRRWPQFFLAMATIVCSYVLSHVWGDSLQNKSLFFSPALYAGQGLWSSFGMLIILNICISLNCFCIFLMRRRFLMLAKRNGHGAELCYSLFIIAEIVLLICYTVFSIRDLLLNSGISLELQWSRGGLGYSLMALLSYSLIMAGIVMLLYMLSPRIRNISGIKFKALSLSSLALASLLFTAMIFSISLKMRLDKESSKAEVWANRLAVDRNLSLELQIRSMEDRIASDSFIPVFADLEDAVTLISAEVREEYFSNLNDYYVEVSVCSNDDRECNAMFNSKLAGGTPLAPGSRFFCNFDSNGRSSYAGTFLYISKAGKIVRMLVEISSKASKDEGGYYSIFNSGGKPGDVTLPEIYSYAKFIDGKLASYKGNYAYPTIYAEPFTLMDASGHESFRDKGYLHFINRVSENEVVVISRRSRGVLSLLTSILSLYAAVLLMLLPLLVLRRKRNNLFRRTFKNRIGIMLTVTVSLALIVLAGVSVKFIFDRNSIDSANMMSEKISAIQNIIESRSQGLERLGDVEKSEWLNLLQDVAATTRSDISLFNPKGLVHVSTAGEMFSNSLLSCRMDGEAYHSIIQNHQRICIQPETIDGKQFYSLYAPIFNKRGETMAIVSSPYNRRSEVMREALPHAILQIILLLAIVIISSAITSHILDRIFDPLIKLSQRMELAGTKGLDYIEYKHNDEISGLVDAYNRMVHDLAESNRILAQNERDKAWSEMARQVAHEIKNPLTPICLEIQKLIYLKQMNDPSWSSKFDNSARIILEHISILTDTANEFSTFAKLYSEEPVRLDLDRTLQDQIELFSNRQDIELTYLGLRDAWILGPKPQLVRVFVNLLTNATQAIEAMQNNAEKEGRERPLGKIRVELRNDIRGGCFEIAFDDNGPGVSEENKARLFTPNFTTKSGGTGLGLAICRNIVEKCNGSISYKKSFTLEGACFTVRLPKTDDNA